MALRSVLFPIDYGDAELSAILRRRVGVVPVESDEERPERGALN